MLHDSWRLLLCSRCYRKCENVLAGYRRSFIFWRRHERGSDGERGKLIFGSIGCASCHTPSLNTGRSKVRALSMKRVEAWTDLLLHDMGPERADICLGTASPSEFRTEPLMGLRLAKVFLHDGAAKTVQQAIELHGGEAVRARKQFARLRPSEREALLKFLASL